MATFPRLKTDAVAQYPARRTLEFRNEAVRFVDGSAQRYRDSARPLRRWEITLQGLDEGELAALDEFFSLMQGRNGAFAFTDPWDGQVYENCSFADGTLALNASGEAQGAASTTIVENRE